MDLTAEQIIGMILSARTLSLEQKGEFLDLFQNTRISLEELTEKLRNLARTEVAYLKKENEELAQLAEENRKTLEEEQAKIAPQEAAIYADLDTATSRLSNDWNMLSRQQEHELDQVLETIQRSEHESDKIASLQAQIQTKK